MHDDFSFSNSNSDAYSYSNRKADGNGVGRRTEDRGPRVDVLSWLSRATLDVIGLAGTFFAFFALFPAFFYLLAFLNFWFVAFSLCIRSVIFAGSNTGSPTPGRRRWMIYFALPRCLILTFVSFRFEVLECCRVA
jgi:hypothetical protein